MRDNALRGVYRAVVLAMLLYASPAWWGYASTSDKQRIDAFIRRGIRLGFYGTIDPTAQQLAEEADQTMFRGSEVQRSPCAPSPPSRHHQPLNE